MDSTTFDEEAAGAHPRRRLRRASGAVLFYAMAAIAAWLVWPSSLGGCTTMIVVNGHSMEPTYHTGDLVVARCGEPAIHDIVVYQPTGYDGARIIHRVIGGDASGWTMKGDNNAFVDPFTPTDDQVIGVARLHIPHVGAVAGFVTSPIVWLSLIVVAIALIIWPSRDDDEDAADDAGVPDGTSEQLETASADVEGTRSDDVVESVSAP